ncbi:putative RecA/RadA recombinase [Roseibium sp. TrichSKD4]|uniref:DUF2190 family protein n=1 Tax=Roseibium sp. TrichSKD4 TaxID=744980 RepID=UPI0001E56CD2|nr:DUF2190 family protein [Roseibium sp. TrichSKD4]EFO32125.1 putative RecA/RadA recombinase [Roseibium sp. TrichSKD4]
MKNYVKEGTRVTFAAPTGGVKGGDGIAIGDLVGIVSYDADEDASCEMHTQGVFVMPKAAADTWAQGVKLYFKASDKTVTTTASGNKFCGYAERAAGADNVEARVLLAH